MMLAALSGGATAPATAPGATSRPAFYVDDVDGPTVVLPAYAANGLRVVVFTAAGFGGAMLALIVSKFYRLRVSVSDRLVRPCLVLAAGMFASMVFMAAEIATRWDLHTITWRTPLGTAAFLLIAFPLLTIKRNLSRALRAAESTGASVRVTLTDTSKPGPDVDLMDKPQTL